MCATHHSSYFVNFSHLVRENILTKSDFFWATFTTHLVYVTLLVSQYIHIRCQILELTIKKKKTHQCMTIEEAKYTVRFTIDQVIFV